MAHSSRWAESEKLTLVNGEFGALDSIGERNTFNLTIDEGGVGDEVPDEALRWLADIVVLADLVQDTDAVTGVCRDPAADAVLAAAIEGRANPIVTGDDDLLVLGDYRGIKILTPRDFLDLIEGSGA